MHSLVDSIDYNMKLAKVTLQGVIDRPGIVAEIFSALGHHGLNVELISTCLAGRGRANVSFAVLESNVNNVRQIMEILKDRLGCQRVVIDDNCALITIYGGELANTPGIAGKIFSKLSDRKINIEMISASIAALNLVVHKNKVMEAIAAIKTEFGI